jgi:hypothetical protein
MRRIAIQTTYCRALHHTVGAQGWFTKKDRFGARVNVLRAFNQGRTTRYWELATDGYTDLSATVKL